MTGVVHDKMCLTDTLEASSTTNYSFFIINVLHNKIVCFFCADSLEALGATSYRFLALTIFEISFFFRMFCFVHSLILLIFSC